MDEKTDEKWKGYLKKAQEKVKSLTSKVSKTVWIALAVILVLIAAGVTIFLNTRPYSVLFTELSSDEASAIISYLEEQGVTNYRLEGGDTITVPTAQVDQLKVKLLNQGYPKSGFAYTYTSQLNSLSTESERSQAILQDLQERMGATIRCLQGVKDATVTINAGEDHSYVLDSNNVVKASASVVVTMQDGGAANTQLVEAIRTLVAHAVKGLEIDNVSIVDSLGNTYSSDTSSNGIGDSDSSSLKMQLEESNNNKIRTEVLSALIPFFGADNVKVSVNCTVDLSYSEQNSTDVHLPGYAEDGSTNGAGIIGSRVYSYTLGTEDETVAAGVGTSENSDLPTYVEQEPTENGQNRLEGSGTINYDNSRDETYTVRTAGYITDCTVAVSINETTAGNINLVELRQHVANAAGITPIVTDTMTADEYLATKVSVLAMPFYNPTAQNELLPGSSILLPSWMPTWALYAAIGGLILFLIVLFVILRILGARKKKKAEEAAAEAAAAAAVAEAAAAAAGEEHVPTVEEILAGNENTEPVGADVMSMQTEKSLELRKSIRKFVEENPELAAQMLKTWLRGGEESNG